MDVPFDVPDSVLSQKGSKAILIFLYVCDEEGEHVDEALQNLKRLSPRG
jgi:hypothetical protein